MPLFLTATRHARRRTIAGLAGFALLTGAATGAGAADVAVSQKGRAFSPRELTISRNDTVSFVNDDQVVHHAFVETPGFSVDSGPQNPGDRSTLKFTKEGTFEVGCRIHPKMKLAVTVK